MVAIKYNIATQYQYDTIQYNEKI